MTTTAERINNQLVRLGLDTGWDPCVGLDCAETVQSEALVRIFNDYADGIYHAESVVETLSAYESLAVEEFWDVIYECEV